MISMKQMCFIWLLFLLLLAINVINAVINTIFAYDYVFIWIFGSVIQSYNQVF